MLTRRQLEELVVEHSHRLHARGWVANHDGNVTARLADDRFLATPSGVSKAAVSRELLLVVDEHGQRVSGNRKAFSELDLHLCVYRQRPDVRAVLHAHPPTATGLSVAGVSVRSTLLAEAVVSLGARIPLIPYARPKSADALSAITSAVADADVLLLEQHGVLTFGPDLETAYLRMELVEHLAKIQLVAMQAGRVREIPQLDIAKLLEARTQAGLGAAGRHQSEETVIPTAIVKSAVSDELRRIAME